MNVYIFAITDLHDKIKSILSTEFRLEELVSINEPAAYDAARHSPAIHVEGDHMSIGMDWLNQNPPFLLSNDIPFTGENLLGLLFFFLNNGPKTSEYLQKNNAALYNDTQFVFGLKRGDQLDPSKMSTHYTPYEEYRLMHNHAILRHYAMTLSEEGMDQLFYYYNEALKAAPSEEFFAYTAKQGASLLIDMRQPNEALAMLEKVQLDNVSETAQIEIKYSQVQAWMHMLRMPYDAELVEKIKVVLWEVVQYYEKTDRSVDLALVLMEAAHVATISESYAESLGYLKRSIDIFETNELTEMRADAFYRKGTLLYTWAQKGNPQFYKPAIEAYQEALKIFTKEAAPDVFADIHHNLGVLYTDMPADEKKRSIWSGLAVASFEEALRFYTKENYPQAFGMICNNFANAFTKFPPAALTDNNEKALFYYQMALEVRTKNVPYARAVTLLNYLEASWDVGNDPEKFNQSRFDDMMQKANEITTLVEDEHLIAEANKHINLLNELQRVVTE